MKRFRTISAAAILVMTGVAEAQAVPPTVTPSPGYDARLQEQRAAQAAQAPADPAVRPTYRRHRVKRAHDYR
jgi:hypothetical protein